MYDYVKSVLTPMYSYCKKGIPFNCYALAGQEKNEIHLPEISVFTCLHLNRGFNKFFLQSAAAGRSGGCDNKRGHEAACHLGGLGACSWSRKI